MSEAPGRLGEIGPGLRAWGWTSLRRVTGGLRGFVFPRRDPVRVEDWTLNQVQGDVGVFRVTL
ncbi:MAG TPA: hypothetical protein VFO69_02160 [Allosphingosinicella sp.]|nr:hypothetical protein [Allosphingosinicella sp.]